MPNINQIRISGTSYDIQDSNATKVVSITQAEYDALPSSAKTANILYNITDAEAVDISQYWTSAETQSAITEATSGKVSTSDFNTYSGSVDTALNSKASQTDLNTLSGTVSAHTANTSIHVSPEQIAAWNAKSDFSGDYNDLTNKLSAGTNITIVDNVISATGGGGGGKAVTGGTNISVVTGETADTINCTLPIYINSNVNKGDINIGTDNNANYDYYRIAIGRKIDMSSTQGGGSIAIGVPTSNTNVTNKCYGDGNVAIGREFQIGASNTYSGARWGCVAIGDKAKSLINQGVAIGNETTVSGTTKTNINNQLTIDTSNQVYIYNKDNTEMICLQDQLGGGGGGGKAIEAGRCITVTTGATADTVSFNLPIGKLTGNSNNCVILGYTYGTGSTANTNSVSTNSYNDFIVGSDNKINVTGSGTFYSTFNTILGQNNELYTTKNNYSLLGHNVMIGNYNTLSGTNISSSFVVGSWNSGYTSNQLISGYHNIGKNNNETALGRYNNSVSASTTFGDSGNTLFSVGNGTANNARHNAFEIRQNGDIYYFDGTNDVKLQDKLSSLDTTIGNINTILESI